MKILLHDLNEEEFKCFKKASNDFIVIPNNKKIHNCIGCFGCWIKTPGTCILKDDYSNMGELISKCKELVIISKCCWGGYSPFVKNVLDRSISYIHPFFEIKNNEMHHKQRYDNDFSIIVFFYGDDLTKSEKDTATRLVKANAVNLNCSNTKVSFFENIQEMDGDIL